MRFALRRYGGLTPETRGHNLRPVAPLLTIRDMTVEDLPAVDGWLREPHVARWWTPETTAERELENFRACIEGAPKAETKMCTITQGGRPIGWGQWYCWGDYPAEAAAAGSQDGDVGADYAIGDPNLVGHGLGTAMIAALVAEVRRHHPDAGMVVAPEAANAASRRVLEKNGFQLVGIRPLATELHNRPLAVYRLDPGACDAGLTQSSPGVPGAAHPVAAASSGPGTSGPGRS